LQLGFDIFFGRWGIRDLLISLDFVFSGRIISLVADLRVICGDFLDTVSAA
jgi:hypothetical protein